MITSKIELHLHLDGSLDLSWAYERAKKRGVIASDTSFEEYYDSWYRKYPTREEGFKKFDIPIDIMQTKEDLHDAAYNMVKTLAEEELFYAEIRLASQQHTQLGLSQLEVLEATSQGVKDAMEVYKGIQVNILNCLMHKGENALVNRKE
ncbi:MAG: adenosine deaminase, partial [Erysipelotrichaceae bacterium]|nr:adenosine deaminase [Erysipelotrichaceae bacterium]